MEASILFDVFDWLWRHTPDVAIVGILILVSVWTAVKINNFGHRFAATERLCNDIHNRQLPEIKTELNSMNDRLCKIELSLNTIITYLSTKSGKFNISDKS